MNPGATLAASSFAVDRLSDRLAALLHSQIERGELNPGDRLPTEPALSAQHGVSRTVVREAVSRLRSQGLLISRQGSGVYVAPRAHSQRLAFDPAVLDSIAAVIDVVEVRRALEGEVAALAAERARPADIAAIEAALSAIEAAVADGRDGVEEDLAFHRAIARATGNSQFGVLLAFIEQYLRDAMQVTRGNEARHPQFMHEVRGEHRALADAIAAGAPEAARAAAVGHMTAAARRLHDAGLQRAPHPVKAGRRTRHSTRTTT